MPRPEKYITETGPSAELAVALRRLRAAAGMPTYRALAPVANYSVSVLAAATDGSACPSWDVTLAFARACKASSQEEAELRALWERASAHKAAQAVRRKARRSLGQSGTAAPSRRSPGQALMPGEPDPRKAKTAAQYVRQMAMLRAWAGQPSASDISREAQRNYGYVTVNAIYDALDLKRITLPRLEVVEPIVRVLAPAVSVGHWVVTWRAIRVREFERDHPDPEEYAAAGKRAQLRVVGELDVGQQGERYRPPMS
jgi:hypothetical protein